MELENTNKRFIRGLFISIILTIIIDVFLFGVKNSDKIQNYLLTTDLDANINTKVTPIQKLNIIIVGDGLLHEALYADAFVNGTYDFKPKLELIKPIIKEYDLAYYNQESILGGKELGVSTYPRFNSPQEFGDDMIDAGFNIVSLANNHTLDRGPEAIINSRAYWNSKPGIMVNGSATSEEERNNIQIMEKNGISYAMISYTTTTNGINSPNNYYVNVFNREKAHEEISRIRPQVDLLMVAMHWGQEYNVGIINEQKEIANFLAEEGVDIVIGAHPHVIEPAQYIGKTLVIYSLGNFISAQRTDEQLSGLMMTATVEKIYNKELNKYEVKVVNPVAKFSYTYRKNVKNYKVYPYNKLNQDIFPNYLAQYNILKARMQSMDPNIKVEPIN